MKKLLFLAILATAKLFSACDFFDQMPFTNYTNPDLNRGNGQCNEDNDCPPGYRCTAWGYCDKCF